MKIDVKLRIHAYYISVLLFKYTYIYWIFSYRKTLVKTYDEQ